MEKLQSWNNYQLLFCIDSLCSIKNMTVTFNNTKGDDLHGKKQQFKSAFSTRSVSGN